jgi:hypothetical protein
METGAEFELLRRFSVAMDFMTVALLEQQAHQRLSATVWRAQQLSESELGFDERVARAEAIIASASRRVANSATLIAQSRRLLERSRR